MSLLQRAPKVAASVAVGLARELYGLDARAEELPSERDQNFLLKDEQGTRFVLKFANGAETRPFLEAQNAALEHLAAHGAPCPRIVPTVGGDPISKDRGGHFIRLVTWVPGRPLGEIPRHSPALLQDIGATLGRIDRALQTFDHPALHREFHWDLAHAFVHIHRALPMIADAEWRGVVARALDLVEARLRSRLPGLRQSIIQNDANDYNILVRAEGAPGERYQEVAGLVDFGDMVHTYTVAEPAIAIAYAILDKPEPLHAAGQIVRGYHAALPLEEAELAVLFDLVVLRLLLSVALTAEQHPHRPDDPYLTISQDPIRRTLPSLLRIHPRFAEAAFRLACGLPGSPRAERVVQWLDRTRTILTCPVGSASSLMPIDLGVASPLIDGDPAGEGPEALQLRIEQALAHAGASVAAGGYREARTLYAAPLFQSSAGAEPRTLHLGLDFWAPAGTPVRAALGGTVHAFADNREPGDYGPVVILRHETGDGEEFFTLYGHLSRASLAGLRTGLSIEEGQVLAAVGDSTENGGWPPHLHLQLITDLLDLGCDFPGVCVPSLADAWCALSPDPNLVTRLPIGSAAGNPAELAQARRLLIGPSVRLSYASPLQISRGWMQYLYDAAGRRLLDAYNNVPHVGHSHPKVVRAAADQLRVLNTNTRYLHELLHQFARRLAATLPDPLNVCYFVNSGSEANELALRLARAATGERDVVVLEGAYHGNTTTLTEISPYKFAGPGGRGRAPWVHVAPLPDVYRGRYRGDPAAAARRYADDVGQVLEQLRASGRGLSAFIAESAPSVAGQIVLPPGYLDRVYRDVRDAGGLCIADEVQTAYGRMGTHFYAFEAQAVVPDIVVLGKPIGNGYPIGAVVTTPAVAASFDNGMEFFSTFGGSTVACAVGLAVLEVVQEERLQSHALEVGRRVLASWNEMRGRHRVIGDVRGSGLFLGLELVSDPEERHAGTQEADYVVNRLREEGILTGTEGAGHNVIKVRPPMPFNDEDADRLSRTLDRVLGELR